MLTSCEGVECCSIVVVDVVVVWVDVVCVEWGVARLGCGDR